MWSIVLVIALSAGLVLFLCFVVDKRCEAVLARYPMLMWAVNAVMLVSFGLLVFSAGVLVIGGLLGLWGPTLQGRDMYGY